MKGITLISLISSLIGLILIYYAATQIQPVQIRISDIDSSLVGRRVSTSGYIVKKYIHPSGHIFLTISDNISKIQVPLFSGFANALAQSGFDLDSLQVGNKLLVSGMVDYYRGQLQIIPRKIDDIKFLK